MDLALIHATQTVGTEAKLHLKSVMIRTLSHMMDVLSLTAILKLGLFVLITHLSAQKYVGIRL